MFSSYVEINQPVFPVLSPEEFEQFKKSKEQLNHERNTYTKSVHCSFEDGRKLITILQEVFEGEDEDRKGICLLMNYPYELALISAPNERS